MPVSYRLGAHYFLFFVSAGLVVAYLPPYLAAPGLSAAEIAWVLAAPHLARVVAPGRRGLAGDPPRAGSTRSRGARHPCERLLHGRGARHPLCLFDLASAAPRLQRIAHRLPVAAGRGRRGWGVRVSAGALSPLSPLDVAHGERGPGCRAIPGDRLAGRFARHAAPRAAAARGDLRLVPRRRHRRGASRLCAPRPGTRPSLVLERRLWRRRVPLALGRGF